MVEILAVTSAIAILNRTLHTLHHMIVVHEAGKLGYKWGDSFVQAIQQQWKNFHDKNDPAQRLVREAKTLYDFKVTGNASSEDIKTQAQAYLNDLAKNVESLENATKCFLKSYEHSIKLVGVLESRNESELDSRLSKFERNLHSFTTELKKFESLIKLPPRKLLYIASNGTNVVEQFNNKLEIVKNCFDELDKKEKAFSAKFNEALDKIPKLLPETSSSSSFPIDKLMEIINQGLTNPEHISKTMQEILPNNTKLTDFCIKIMQIYAVFKKNEKPNQASPFEFNPNWLPLLTEEKQIKKGQRIFLHAMDERKHSADEKLLLAQLFLHQPASKDLIDGIEVSCLSCELTCVLCGWQIKQCEEAIEFLSTMRQGARLIWPNYARVDGWLKTTREKYGTVEWRKTMNEYVLTDWLKDSRKYYTAIDLFASFLVVPCYLDSYEYDIESEWTRFKALYFKENSDLLLQQCLDSYWGAIREKIHKLIQLPKSFTSKICRGDRFRSADQSENSEVVSPIMHELAEKLITDLERLKAELEQKRAFLREQANSFCDDKTKALGVQKNQEHETGVERIKKSHRYINPTISSSSILYPYLYDREKNDEVNKKPQVPTIDDLLQVIYRGVDLNSVCHWKDNSQPFSKSNQLLHYFLPNKLDDSRKRAWIYAIGDCQPDPISVFSYLWPSPTNRCLAIENTRPEEPTREDFLKDTFLIEIILKDPNKIYLLPTHSKVLNEMLPEKRKKAEAVFRQLQNYYVLAFASAYPEYRNSLPFMQKIGCVIKDLFQSTPEIRLERLESVKAFISCVIAVLSAENASAIIKAIDGLKKDYDEECLLYVQCPELEKIFSIFMWVRITWNKKVEIKQPEIVEEEGNISEAQMKGLEENMVKMNQDKETMREGIKELNATQSQHNSELESLRIQLAKTEAMLKKSEEQRKQDKEKSDKKIEKLEEDMKLIKDALKVKQFASTSSESDADISESNNVRFFKH